jgi:hypothetical protein
VINTVTIADVRWACGLLNRLTDEQWHDAFRAGGYHPEQPTTRSSRAKIAQGLQIAAG